MAEGWEETRQTARLPPRSSKCQTPERFFFAFSYCMHTAVQKCKYLGARRGTVMPAWLVCLAVMLLLVTGSMGTPRGQPRLQHLPSGRPPASGLKIAWTIINSVGASYFPDKKIKSYSSSVWTLEQVLSVISKECWCNFMLAADKENLVACLWSLSMVV